MNFRAWLRAFWIATPTITEDELVKEVLADVAMTQAAVQFVVHWCRRNDMARSGRAVLFGLQGPWQSTSVLNVLMHQGLNFLEMEIEGCKLGDYFPPALVRMASRHHAQGMTMILHAEFFHMVAQACPDSERSIRQQLSAEAIDGLWKDISGVAVGGRVGVSSASQGSSATDSPGAAAGPIARRNPRSSTSSRVAS